MATNRFRALRNVSNRLNNLQSRMSYLDRRPAPRRLADNFIFTNNIQRVAIVEPLVAADAITNEKLTDDSVDTDEIQLDAITGKNINSCTITDSSFSNGDISDSNMSNMTADTVIGSNYTLDTVTGSDFTLDTVDIDGLVLINGEITDTTLDGAGVVLTECTLANCTANVINGDGGLLLVGNGTVGINGEGVAIEGGGSVITVASGNVGIGAGGSGAQFDGSNTNLFGSQVIMAPGWNNVRAGGLAFWGHPQFVDVKDTAEQALDLAQQALDAANAAQASADSKAPAGHSHPGL